MKSWWFRMKPRSILRTIEWFPSFAKLEGRDWNEKDEIRISARTGNSINVARREYIYDAHGEDFDLNLDEFMSGEYDTVDVESAGRNDKISFEFFGFGYVDTNNIINTIYEVMKGNIKADEAIKETKYFDIIPSNLNLASADLEFAKTGKEYILKETLVEIEKRYDFIILDTPPALGILTVNAFTYVDDIIIPTNASIFASSGIMQLFNSIETVKKYCNPNVKIDGILFTKFNERTIIASEIKELTEIISKEIKTKVYKTQVRNSVMVEEAQANS